MSVHSAWMVMVATRPPRGKQNKRPMCASAVYRQSRMPTAGAKAFADPVSDSDQSQHVNN